MLILTRGIGEKIVIPGIQAQISIIAIVGTRVQLGIEAPKDVSIRRQEFFVDSDEVTEKK